MNHITFNPNGIELLLDNLLLHNNHPPINININFPIFNPNAHLLLPIYRPKEPKKEPKYNYFKMKEDMKKSGIAEELMAHIFHPRNMKRWMDWGFTEHQEMIDFNK